MKNLFKNFLIFLIYKVFTEKETLAIAEQRCKSKPFIRDTRVINVKKGSRRYTLLVIQALDGRYTINLGRHEKDQQITINGTI